MRWSSHFLKPSEGFTGGAVYPQSTLPWTTPWRIITMGSTPGVIVESTHGTDLAKPSEPGDFSYVNAGQGLMELGTDEGSVSEL